MTAKSLICINNQTFPGIQKLFINTGRDISELNFLRAQGALTDDWEIFSFPIPIFDNSLLEASYCIAVKTALANSIGKYFFGMNDDDHLAVDFFERMSNLFTKYPDAISGIGLMNRYFHANSRIVAPPIGSGKGLNWKNRPEIEDGINVFRQFYGKRNYYYNPNPGFAYVCRIDKIKEVEKTYLYGAGYPDNSCLIQIVSRGKTVFDPNAHMYWGRHEKQEHLNYDTKHYWDCSYKEHLKRILDINIDFMKKYHPHLVSEQKMLKQYFRIVLIDSSINSFLMYLKKRGFVNLRLNTLQEIDHGNKKFPIIRHLCIILSHPNYIFRRILKKLSFYFFSGIQNNK